MCFGLYLQVIVVIGSSVNQGSGHPEILDHRVGSVANLSEILTGNSFRGPGNNRKSIIYTYNLVKKIVISYSSFFSLAIIYTSSTRGKLAFLEMPSQ